MSPLTHVNWALTGLEGVVNIFEALVKDGATITDEMQQRLAKATERLTNTTIELDKRVENR